MPLISSVNEDLESFCILLQVNEKCDYKCADKINDKIYYRSISFYLS